MKKLVLILTIIFFSTYLFASDEKPGRYFEDQPDVTDKPQVHFIYLLNKDSEDREWDINGKMEKELLEANEKMLKMTKGNQKFRYDLREDGKMDISFVRFDKQYKGMDKQKEIFQDIKVLASKLALKKEKSKSMKNSSTISCISNRNPYLFRNIQRYFVLHT